MTALTSDDVIVAKAALANHAAGIYGSASLVGRVILYLPSAIITVLLPRVAARVAGRQSAEDLLFRSADVTFAVCVMGTLVYAVAGGPITNVAFGSDYDTAAGLLWQFGIAMTGYALLNVLLVYHLGRDDSRMSWLLLGGAITQLVLFAILHGSPHQLIAVDGAVALALIAAHELLIDNGLTRWLARPVRWAFRRFA
jgi:O-antigen/teichoic acid export membrane protein